MQLTVIGYPLGVEPRDETEARIVKGQRLINPITVTELRNRHRNHCRNQFHQYWPRCPKSTNKVLIILLLECRFHLYSVQLLFHQIIFRKLQYYGWHFHSKVNLGMNQQLP